MAARARKTGARLMLFHIINFKSGSEPTSYMEKSGLPDVRDSAFVHGISKASQHFHFEDFTLSFDI